MAVVANVAINVDSRGAAQKLQQFQQQSTAAGRAAEQLQGATGKVGREMQTAANGMRFFIDAAGRARKENGQFVTTAEAAAAGLKKQGQAADEAGRSMSRLERIMAQLATTVGAAGVGRFAAGITRTAATFEGELRRAAAIEGGGNFDKLRGDIERVAASAAGTPTQVAALATALSRAGFTAEETGQSLQGIVRGAEATAVTFEQMGSIASDAMRSFGIETSQTESVVDVLVKTANSSNQSILDLGEALSYAAPTAKTLGISINDLSAVIGLLADRGIRGSRAGTALSTGFNRLQLAATGSQDALLEITRGSAMLTKAMNALGSEVLTAEGKLKPLDEVLIAMKRNLDNLSVGQRVEITKALFGEEAGRSFQTLLASSEEGIRKMIGAMNDAGGTARDTQKQMQGFSYTMDVLGGNVEVVSNQIGDKFIAVLQPMIQGLNDAFAASQQLPKPLRDLAAGAAALGIAVAGVTLALKALIPVAKIVIGLMGPAGLAGVIAAGPWIALAAGITVAVGALASYRSEAEKLAGAAAAGGAPAVAAARNAAAQKGQEISLLEQQRKTASGRERGSIDRRLATLRSERANLLQSARAGDVAGGTGTAAAAALPSGGGAAVGGKTGRAGGGKADKAAAEAARAAEQQAQQLKSAQDLLFTQNNQLALLRAQNEYQSAFVTFGNTRAEIERKYNELLAQSKSQQETQLLQQARAAEYKQSSLTLEQRILDLNRQATQPLDDILKRLKDQAAYEREYGELIKNGTNAELAKQIIEINRAYEASVEALQPALAAAQAAVTKAEAEGASATEIAKYRKELERIQELQGGLAKKRNEAVTAATAAQPKAPSVMDNIGEKIKQLKAELDPVKVATDSIVGGATAIGNAFGQAFQDVATGAKSTQEALADAFKSIGQAFVSMAAEIIAKQLTLILLQSIFNALSGGPSVPRGTPGAKAPNGKPYYGPAFAEGGFVTGPTQALIGEGGEPEYVIPQSKMASAMARYSRGARGEAVIPSSGGGDAAAGGEAPPSAPIDVRYTVERINSVDYVTADQFQQGMARAAAQGAQRGEQRALASLRQNTNVRRSVGI